jgi:hypothetical protein
LLDLIDEFVFRDVCEERGFDFGERVYGACAVRKIFFFGERGLVEISERDGRFEVGIRKVNLLVS